MDIRKVLGGNVRRHRLALGLSQEAVAERMGVDRAYVSGIERGRQNATIISVWQASLALKVRPMDLLDDSKPVASAGDSRKRLTGKRTKNDRPNS